MNFGLRLSSFFILLIFASGKAVAGGTLLDFSGINDAQLNVNEDLSIKDNRCSNVKLFGEEMNKEVLKFYGRCHIVTLFNSAKCKILKTHILDVDLKRKYVNLLASLGFENTQEDNIKFAKSLAELSSVNLECSSTLNIDVFMFKLLELEMVKQPQEFLVAFLSGLSKEKFITFTLSNIKSFLKDRKEFVQLFNKHLLKDEAKAQDQFINLYLIVVDSTRNHTVTEKVNYISKTMFSTLRTGGFYGLLYLTSQLEVLKSNYGFPEPFSLFKNMGLIYVSHLLMRAFDNFNTKIEPEHTQMVTTLDTENNIFVVETKDLGEIVKTIKEDATRAKINKMESEEFDRLFKQQMIDVDGENTSVIYHI